MTDFKTEQDYWVHCEIEYDDEYFEPGPIPLTIEDLTVDHQIVEEVIIVISSSKEKEKEKKK